MENILYVFSKIVNTEAPLGKLQDHGFIDCQHGFVSVMSLGILISTNYLTLKIFPNYE